MHGDQELGKTQEAKKDTGNQGRYRQLRQICRDKKETWIKQTRRDRMDTLELRQTHGAETDTMIRDKHRE